MHSLIDVEAFLFKLLGSKPTRQFESNMDEFSFFVKAEALTNAAKSESDMRKLAKETCEKILQQSVKTYLSDNFANEKGELSLKVDNGTVYDKDMQPVRAISAIRDNMSKISDVIIENIMEQFCAGRKLAQDIVSRMMHYQESKDAKPLQDPPLEVLEIERMRLERKLPRIEPHEAKRLCFLCAALRAK
jgi:hypothetical protein